MSGLSGLSHHAWLRSLSSFLDAIIVSFRLVHSSGHQCVWSSLDALVLDHASGVDQRQMRETLWEVPDVPSCNGVVLFRKKAQMILDGKQTFEEFYGFVLSSLKGVIVGKPEAACEEGTL